MTTRDTTEMKLVSQIFDFARALAEFRLSDEQLALYSGYILLQDDRQGLRNADEVRRLNQAVLAALHRELTNNPPHVPTKGDVSILQLLTNRRLALREISFLHRGPGQIQELESWTGVPSTAQRTLPNVVIGNAGLAHR